MAVGWGSIAAGLWRGLTGRARAVSLAVHGITPVGALLISSITGLGFIYTLIGLAAQWWALILLTRLRPELLVAPISGGLMWLSAWLALTGSFAYGLSALIL